MNFATDIDLDELAGIYGFPMPEPEPMDSEEYIKTLHGSAGDAESAAKDAENAVEAAPCDEHKAGIREAVGNMRQAADKLRGMAEEAESVIKDRAS